MLVKLLPDQVAKLWDVIKYSINQALPPIANGAPDKMNTILRKLLMMEMHCWISVRDDKRVDSILVTTFSVDDCSDTRNLLIYSLYGEEASRKSWMEGLKTLQQFAKAHRCHRIIAYTEVESMKKFAEMMGGEARYTFITFPVPD